MGSLAEEYRVYPVTLPDGRVVYYPSVTTGLSILRRPRLERWRGAVGNAEADRIAAEAAALGAAVHEAVRLFNLALRPDGRFRPFDDAYSALEPPERRLVDAYIAWHDAAVARTVAVERRVTHHGYQYAGTLDLLVEIRGDTLPALVDIKTTGDVYPEQALQLAAYQAALESEDVRVGRRLIVWLPKDDLGRYQVVEFGPDAYPMDFRHFLYALELWRRFEGRVLDVRSTRAG